MVNESNHGSCLTELIDGRVGHIAVRECRRRVESCRESDGADGRSCRTDVLGVSSSVSDRVFVAAFLFCTGRCCTGGVTFTLGRCRRIYSGLRRHPSEAVGRAGVTSPLP